MSKNDATIVCPKCKGEEFDQEWCWDCGGTGRVSIKIKEKLDNKDDLTIKLFKKQNEQKS